MTTSLEYLPVECAMAFLFVVDVVALVLTTIWPLEDTWAFHFVVAPHASIFTTVGPVVNACKNILESGYTLRHA